MSIEVKRIASPDNLSFNFHVSVPAQEAHLLGVAIYEEVVSAAGKAVARAYVEAHLAEILGKISPEAIATLAMAEAGAAVNKTLKEVAATRVVHSTRTDHIYHSGILSSVLSYIGL